MKNISSPYTQKIVLDLKVDKESLKCSSFARLTDDLIKKIFFFVNQPIICRDLISTCRIFLKLGFESCNRHMEVSANLIPAVYVNNSEAVRHLMPNLKNKDIHENEPPNEEKLLHLIQCILKENKDAMLITKIGHALQFRTSDPGYWL
jgi:hypothetical protein